MWIKINVFKNSNNGNNSKKLHQQMTLIYLNFNLDFGLTILILIQILIKIKRLVSILCNFLSFATLKLVYILPISFF